MPQCNEYSPSIFKPPFAKHLELGFVLFSFSPLSLASLLFSAILRPPQTTVLPFYIYFSWGRFWSLPSVSQFSSVAQSCPTLCDPMDRSTPGLPVYHQLPEFIQTHVRQVSDAIQPSHPLSSPSPPAPNPSQNQSLFQWVNSSHEVAKVLEFQL